MKRAAGEEGQCATSMDFCFTVTQLAGSLALTKVLRRSHLHLRQMTGHSGTRVCLTLCVCLLRRPNGGQALFIVIVQRARSSEVMSTLATIIHHCFETTSVRKNALAPLRM